MPKPERDNTSSASMKSHKPGADAAPEQEQGGWSTDRLAYLQKKSVKQRVYVVHPFVKDTRDDVGVRSPEARLDEALGLAAAIDIDLVGGETVPLRGIKPSTYLGAGKTDELANYVKIEEIEIVVFDCELSPIQQRNLERALKAKVIDRTALILEIFGDRASTKEGELQVELAHLVYQRSRLVRSWTHLERQRGGSGFLGGPGETQIEADRRIIADRITKIRRQLESVTRTRTLHRARRQKTPYPVVALVGYTNAGKSTLFNRLTDAEVMAEDMLFATLDPTMRSIELPSGKKTILSDTVGFISELPTTLVAAFRATLEEVLEADVIVHVRDASHPDTNIQKTDVEHVLKDLGVELQAHDESGQPVENGENHFDPATSKKANIEPDATPTVEVMNKTDMLSPSQHEHYLNVAKRHQNIVPVSGLTGEGCQQFIETIDSILSARNETIQLLVPYSDGVTPAWLHSNAKILDSQQRDEGTFFVFSVDPIAWGKFSKGKYYATLG